MAKHTTTPEDSPAPAEPSNKPVPADKPVVIDESKKAPAPAPAPAPEAPPAEAPAAQPSTPLAAVQAEVQAAADAGHPDPLAQIKISGAAGAHGDLVTELSKLPPIAALDGLKANAAAGYFRGVPKDELIATLKGLPFEDESARVQRDWLVQRAESGEFSRG
jgi:outer membrane biosynthesis protein TonB